MMEKIIVYLLMTALSVTTLSVYGYGFIAYTSLVLLLLGAAVFAVCEFTNKYNRMGTLLVGAVFALETVIFIPLLKAGFGQTGMYFQQWMLTRGEDAGSIYYLFVLMLGSSTFFGFCVYYFTQIRYRISLLTLVSIIPFVLYAKVIAEVDNYYLVIIAFLNLLAAMYHVKNKVNADNTDVKRLLGDFIAGKNSNTTDSRLKLTVYAALFFTISVVFLGAVCPKKSEAVFYDRFEELFLNNGQKDEIGEAELSSLTEISGDADGFRSDVNRRLFTLKGNRAVYLKRQSFDLYDFENNYWTKDEQFLEYRDFSKLSDVSNNNLSLATLLLTMEKAERIYPGFLGDYGLYGLIKERMLESVKDDVSSLVIYPLNFEADYYLTTARCVALIDHMGSGKWYSIYIQEDKGVGSEFIGAGGGNMDIVASERFLEKLYNIVNGKSESLSRCAKAFLDMTHEAVYYNDAMNENTSHISRRVRELAEEITKDCQYDYEKAYAIQDYFYNGEFTYDLDYDAPDDSVEYFLFESKTGTCSDFATAYVLMARSVGLTVRYVEGFVPTASSREGYYYVKETNSHAYPEVFLPLMGWMVFEPTISGDAYGDTFFDKIGVDIQMDYDLIQTIVNVIIVISLLGIFVRVVYPVLAELFFMIHLCFIPERERPYRRYKRLFGKLNRKYGGAISAMTPREVAAYYNQKTKGKKDITILIEKLEETVYR